MTCTTFSMVILPKVAKSISAYAVTKSYLVAAEDEPPTQEDEVLDVNLLERQSCFGVFVRRSLLWFEKMSMEAVCKLLDSLITYREDTSNYTNMFQRKEWPAAIRLA